jgi:hypothetical protein
MITTTMLNINGEIVTLKRQGNSTPVTTLKRKEVNLPGFFTTILSGDTPPPIEYETRYIEVEPSYLFESEQTLSGDIKGYTVDGYVILLQGVGRIQESIFEPGKYLYSCNSFEIVENN